MHTNHHIEETPQATGCLPRSSKVGENALFPVAGTVDACPLLSRSDWIECSIRHKVWTVIDQNPQSSCCPSAAAGAAMILREIAGQKRILLSQGSLYGQINGGRDAGANIEDALDAMMNVGVCPASQIDPKNWQGRGWPRDWKAEAKKFRVLEAFDCPTFDAVASAVQRGMPVVFGVFWGAGGHALTAVGLKKNGGGWNLEFLNSWGASWGDGGLGFLPEAKCRGIATFGAFALRSVAIPAGEDLPPALK
ncbi:MAG: hypothetical protein IT426_12040 [Pirellulales bacterium]|nr:hypothetical protein [Pirellulales bacterium]